MRRAGKLLWHKDLQVLSLSTAGMSIANGLLSVLASLPSFGRNAVDGLYAFDLRTGTLRWSLATEQTGLYAATPLVVSKNLLYAMDDAGDVYAIDAVRGQVLWSAPPALDADGKPFGTPVRMILYENELFIGASFLSATQFNVVLHAFNITTRTENWEADLTGGDKDNLVGIDVAL